MNRRFFMFSAASLGLAGCSASSAVTLEQVKVYVMDGVDALSAAGQAFLIGPPIPAPASAQLVDHIIGDLQTLNSALQGVTDISSAKATVTQVIALLDQLTPIVSAFLGVAAPYVPLVVAVLTAFIQSLPAPPDAPATPPAQLHRMALRYKRHQ